MKKTIITLSLLTAVFTTGFAAELLEVTKLENINNQTIVTVNRISENTVSMSGNYIFQGTVNMQNAVTKMSYYADPSILVTGKGASSTQGQVNVLAKLRSDAWYSKGLTGYFVELAKQMDLMK